MQIPEKPENEKFIESRVADFRDPILVRIMKTSFRREYASGLPT